MLWLRCCLSEDRKFVGVIETFLCDELDIGESLLGGVLFSCLTVGDESLLLLTILNMLLLLPGADIG